MATYVFDLDGTIVESAPGILASLRHTLQSLGLEARADSELRRMIGPPLRATFTTLLGGDERLEETVIVYREHHARVGLAMSEPFPGIVAQLEQLHHDGHALFVCTSKLETFARTILDRLELTPLFAAIYGERAAGDHKPATLARLVAEHGVDPACAVMIGDRREDVLAGQANGLATLGVLWGYGDLDELSEAGARATCAAVDDLGRALRGLA